MQYRTEHVSLKEDNQLVSMQQTMDMIWMDIKVGALDYRHVKVGGMNTAQDWRVLADGGVAGAVPTWFGYV